MLARANRNTVGPMDSSMRPEYWIQREREEAVEIGMRVAIAMVVVVVVRMWDAERGAVGRTAYKFANSIYLSRGVA